MRNWRAGWSRSRPPQRTKLKPCSAPRQCRRATTRCSSISTSSCRHRKAVRQNCSGAGKSLWPGNRHASRRKSRAANQKGDCSAGSRCGGCQKHAAAEAGQEAGNASSTGGASDSAKRASSAFGVFAKRLKSIVFSALIFNVISSACGHLTSALGSAVAKTDGFGTALARLKGAAATAAAPLVNALGSALTYVMNLAAKRLPTWQSSSAC